MASDVIYNRLKQITCASCSTVLDVSKQEPFAHIACTKCGAKLTVPAMLGPFLLLEVLGQGGMGAVYRALDQSLGRYVAIKVMKRALGQDAKLVESFLREARAAATLNHANIVQIYSCGEQAGQPYIAMELVSGGRLDLMMEGNKKLAEDLVLKTGLDVAEGLKAANEAGLVHGDIKPANILFDKHNIAKIVDFGLAQFVNAQQSHEIWGTPYYISPERARGGKADHRSDIYSLGATMYHALAGQPPFEGPTASDVVVARLKAPADDIRKHRPDLRPETATLINRMIASDASVRYPTSASLLADMKEAMTASKRTSGKIVTSKTTTDYLPSGEPEKKSKAGLIIGVLIVAGAVGGWLALRGGKPATNGGTAAPPSAVTNTAVVTPSTPAAQIITEVFFKDAGEKKLVEALKDLGAAKDTAGIDKLRAATADVPANSGRALWLKLFEGTIFWLQGNKEVDAAGALSEVSSAKVPADKMHPNNLPRAVARAMLGETSEKQLNTAMENAPEWAKDFVALTKAVNHLRHGSYWDARPLLDQYVSATGTKPSWPYAFQPAVRGWLLQIDQYRILGAQFKKDNNNQALSQAKTTLLAATPPIFSKVNLDQLLAPAPPKPYKLLMVDSSAPETPGENLIDNNPATHWHTRWSNSPQPHEAQLDLIEEKNLIGFTYLPRQDGSPNGRVADFEVYVSNDPKKWGEPAAKGTFSAGNAVKKILFDKPTKGRYLRFRSLSEQSGQPYASCAELDVVPAP